VKGREAKGERRGKQDEMRQERTTKGDSGTICKFGGFEEKRREIKKNKEKAEEGSWGPVLERPPRTNKKNEDSKRAKSRTKTAKKRGPQPGVTNKTVPAAVVDNIRTDRCFAVAVDRNYPLRVDERA
jgi:hypothetical protein